MACQTHGASMPSAPGQSFFTECRMSCPSWCSNFTSARYVDVSLLNLSLTQRLIPVSKEWRQQIFNRSSLTYTHIDYARHARP